MDVLASLKVCVSRAALTEIETEVLTTNQDTTVSDTEMHPDRVYDGRYLCGHYKYLYKTVSFQIHVLDKLMKNETHVMGRVGTGNKVEEGN
jgi:hypothetical protein